MVANAHAWSAIVVGIVGVAIGAAAACNASAFACLEATDCSNGEIAGTCEATGWCSFDDPDCESGARYGEHAGDGLAGTCVDVEGTTTTDASTTLTTTTSATTTATTSTTSDPTTDPVTTSTTASTSDTTDDTGVPVCGNGELEADELCDDGNETPADGCSELCVPSGSVVWDRSIAGDSEAHGHSLDLFVDGDLAVGYSAQQGNAVVPGVARVGNAGDMVWKWEFAQGEWSDAYTWGLDVALVDEEGEHIAVAVDGFGQNIPVAGIAVLDDLGEAEWFDFRAGVIPFGAAMQLNGVTVVAGTDGGAGGVVYTYNLDGATLSTTFGEPYTPDDGFAFDVMLDGDVFYFAGIYGEPGEETAFLGATTDAIVIRHDFSPSTHNEGLALAIDPASTRRWIAGYAEDTGGWIAVADSSGILVDATIVTDTFPANLHGIAVDPSGAAIAVGWDSTGGTRDAYVVKVAPDGAKIWTTSFTTPGGDDDLRDVAIAPDGSVFVIGTRVDDLGVASAWFAQLVP